jgi:hypothetical protein
MPFLNRRGFPTHNIPTIQPQPLNVRPQPLIVLQRVSESPSVDRRYLEGHGQLNRQEVDVESEEIEEIARSPPDPRRLALTVSALEALTGFGSVIEEDNESVESVAWSSDTDETVLEGRDGGWELVRLGH